LAAHSELAEISERVVYSQSLILETLLVDLLHTKSPIAGSTILER
jgi:hypothetical protein